MRFRILGPLEVWDDDRLLVLGGPQQRALLALLLLDANRVVSADRLVGHLWGETPPSTARGLLQGCVAQLRRTLRTGQGASARQPLLTRSPGYLVDLRPGELDLDRFTELDRAARAAVGTGPAGWEEAASLWSEALALWRGPALDDVTLEACRTQAAALEERRLAVLEERIDADLRLGRCAGLVGELHTLVRAHPLRERLWAQLMLALYGADRQADALAAYQELRRTLVDQLGVEPGGSVRALQQAILTGADALTDYLHRRGSAVADDEGPGQRGPKRAGTSAHVRPIAADATPVATPPGPAQLPAATAAFTGRTRHLKRLDELLVAAEERAALGVISGTAGVGKTALAVQWAHQVRDRFGDGQLYADLRGFAAGSPTPPAETLAGFLHALGVPPRQVPADPPQAAALYRSLLAGRRVLVVLDNARNAEQVRPLLPGGPGCVALVTSRDRLGGLVVREGAQHLGLDVLEPGEARSLLARVLGQERVQADPRAAAELVQLCARLPLALRIAAAHLTIQHGRSIAAEVAELTAGNRLGALEVDGDEESAVRAAFDRSYATLSPDARRLFRLLGLVSTPDISAPAAAALADLTPAAAASLLDGLAGAHLLGYPAPGRYAFHDLLGLYAAERAAAEDAEADRERAAARLLHGYLVTADAADRLLNPDRIRLPMPVDDGAGQPPRRMAVFENHNEAQAWLDAERANLVAAVLHAATHGPRPVTWLLAHTLKGYFQLRMYTLDWQTVAERALAAATAEGDLAGQIASHLGLAARLERQADYPRAATHNTHALALARQAGWREAEAIALAELGILRRRAGDLKAATELFTQALDVARQTGWLPLIMARLAGLGNLYAEAGHLDRAADYYTQALPVVREIGSRGGEAVVLANLGECCVVLGRLDEALGHFTQALELNREIGHRGQAADNLRALATAHCDAGRPADALELAQAALSGSRETGDRRYEADALNVIGTAYQRLGTFDRAVVHHREALQLSREIGIRQHEVAALIGLAHSHQHLGQSDQATTYADQALSLARQDGFRLLEGPARTALATVKLVQGHVDDAVGQARKALDVHRDTGHRLGAARTLLVLGRALAHCGDLTAATAEWHRALDIFTEVGSPEAEQVRQALGSVRPVPRAPC